MPTDPNDKPVAYEPGGLYRCCVAVVPDRRGTEHGEHIPCPHHGTPEDPSGVKWDGERDTWIAAWRTD